MVSPSIPLHHIHAAPGKRPLVVVPGQHLDEAVAARWRNASLIRSLLASAANMQVRSRSEPDLTGVRTAMPSGFPSSSGMILPIIFAAPVEAGMRFSAAARPRRSFLRGPSSSFWGGVQALYGIY